MSDPRRSAVVHELVLDITERHIAPAIAEARGVERLERLFATMVQERADERPSERIRREDEAALNEMAALGNGRDTAMKVARRRAPDPHTREILAQRFRRLRLKQTKRAVLG